MALDGGRDGLYFYRKIAAKGGDFLKENGKIFVEIGHDQKEEVTKIFTDLGFTLKESKADLAGFMRVLGFKNSPPHL